MKHYIFFILSIFLLLPPTAEAAEQAPAGVEQPESVFIVSGYRYEPEGNEKDTDLGQSLCGTQCKAMSVDYLNYTGPGGWRLIKIADKKEVTVDLNNPFLAGKCVCVADEYELKVNELYMSKKGQQVKEEK